jgi:hypothetical protein
MLSALSKLTCHRIWFVPQFTVWGIADWSQLELLMLEEVDSVKTILFNTIAVGDNSQSVLFSDLIDFRGNCLPGAIRNPRVLMRRTGEHSAFVVGGETSQGFKIARSADAAGPVRVDLMIVELGD